MASLAHLSGQGDDDHDGEDGSSSLSGTVTALTALDLDFDDDSLDGDQAEEWDYLVPALPVPEDGPLVDLGVAATSAEEYLRQVRFAFARV